MLQLSWKCLIASCPILEYGQPVHAYLSQLTFSDAGLPARAGCDLSTCTHDSSELRGSRTLGSLDLSLNCPSDLQNQGGFFQTARALKTACSWSLAAFSNGSPRDLDSDRHIRYAEAFLGLQSCLASLQKCALHLRDWAVRTQGVLSSSSLVTGTGQSSSGALSFHGQRPRGVTRAVVAPVGGRATSTHPCGRAGEHPGDQDISTVHGGGPDHHQCQ